MLRGLFIDFFDDNRTFASNKSYFIYSIIGICCSLALAAVINPEYYDDHRFEIVVFAFFGSMLALVDKSYQLFRKYVDYNFATGIYYFSFVLFTISFFLNENTPKLMYYFTLCIGILIVYILCFGGCLIFNNNGFLSGKYIFNNLFFTCLLIYFYTTNANWDFHIDLFFCDFEDEMFREGMIYFIFSHILHVLIDFIFKEGTYLLPFKIGHIHLTPIPMGTYITYTGRHQTCNKDIQEDLSIPMSIYGVQYHFLIKIFVLISIYFAFVVYFSNGNILPNNTIHDFIVNFRFQSFFH